MSEEQDSFLSWTVIPEPKWESAWAAFHDAKIVSLTHNLEARSVDLALRLGFPRSIEPRPEVARLHILGVKRLMIYLRVNHVERLNQQQLRIDNPSGAKIWEEWYEFGHYRTASLPEFIELIEGGIDVLDPYISVISGFSIGLGGFGPTEDVNWYWLRIDGGQVEISLDGTPSTMSELLELGARAWDAWVDR